MQVVFDDRRLNPIRGKVVAGQRLSFEDGVTLYRTPDILALGYLANLVRERLHGSKTYFNVNRHINPTDVCVASCRLCAFGKRVRDPRAYTLSLEEVWQRAGEGWSEAETEFHIVGGLHPELTLDWFCKMLRGLKQRFPTVHLKAFTMVEIAYLARRSRISIRETLERGLSFAVSPHQFADSGYELSDAFVGFAEALSDLLEVLFCLDLRLGQQDQHVIQLGLFLGQHSHQIL